MTSVFEKYNDIILDAFQSFQKPEDIILKKKDILDQVVNYYNLKPTNILFVGFNPAIFKITGMNVYISDISDAVFAYLEHQGVKFTRVDVNNLEPKLIDVTVALDEYFTFADSDTGQKNSVNALCSITRNILVTSLKDYKNQDYKEREFSHPLSIKNTSDRKIFFEGYDYDPVDKNVFYGVNYILDDEGIMTAGPFTRREMFFKQLAKFCIDAGAKNFLVHKNIMYKNLIKRNYEHLITIEF